MVSAVDDGLGDEALRLLLALFPALHDMSLPDSALAALRQAADRSSDPALAAAANGPLALLCFNAGHGDEARRRAQAAVQATPPSPPGPRAWALYFDLAVRWHGTPDAQGLRPAFDEALATAQAAQDDGLLARLWQINASISRLLAKDTAQAETHLARALAHAERTANRHLMDAIHYSLAGLHYRQGRITQALSGLAQVAASAHERGDWEGLSAALYSQGNALSKARRWPDAVAAFRDSVRVAWQCMSSQELAYALWNMPLALARTGEPEQCAASASLCGQPLGTSPRCAHGPRGHFPAAHPQAGSTHDVVMRRPRPSGPKAAAGTWPRPSHRPWQRPPASPAQGERPHFSRRAGDR